MLEIKYIHSYVHNYICSYISYRFALILTSQQIFMLLLTLSSTQNIMGSASMIRPALVSTTLMSNNSLVCGSQTLPTHKSSFKLSAPAEPSHTIGSFITGDQTKEARSPKAYQTLLSLWQTNPYDQPDPYD